MERRELQAIALAKLEDSELLFQNERYSNAYYLFGYAAEIAIKAVIAKLFLPETIPDKAFVNSVYSHNLEHLIGAAGLATDLKQMRAKSPAFDAHWATVSGWSETSRYDMVSVFRATALRNAMVEQKDGVFPWLQNHW